MQADRRFAMAFLLPDPTFLGEAIHRPDGMTAEAVVGSTDPHVIVDRISADVQAMKMGLEELQATWRGSAASNFHALVLEWALTQGKVEASLASINVALASAATSYAEVEQGNTQRFAY